MGCRAPMSCIAGAGTCLRWGSATGTVGELRRRTTRFAGTSGVEWLEQAMAVPTEAALSALAPLVGAGVRPAGDADAVMGVRPAVVVEPADEDEIAAVLAWAHRAAATVLVRGGGTQLGMGAPPSAGDIVLSMARLNAQLEHAPHDQTTTVQAGMPPGDVPPP